MAADGILAGKHAIGERLAHYDDGLFRLRVEVVEITAPEDRNAERGKESGRDRAEVCARIVFRTMDMAIRRKLQARAVEAAIPPRGSDSESRLHHSRHCVNPADRFLVEIHHLLRRYLVVH